MMTAHGGRIRRLLGAALCVLGIAQAALAQTTSPAMNPAMFPPPRAPLPERLAIVQPAPTAQVPTGQFGAAQFGATQFGAAEAETLSPGAVPIPGPVVFGQTGFAASGVSQSGGLQPQQSWIGPQPVEPPAFGAQGRGPTATLDSRLSGARPGIVQRAQFFSTWLAPGGDDGMGMTDLDARVTLGVPVPGMWPPFLVTPQFAAHFLQGPDLLDVPARLFDTAVDFRWLKPINDRWAVDLGVAPGWYSDFESSSSEALRVQGRALGIYQWSPGVKVVLGVVYLDREDVGLLPAGGLIWEGQGGDTKIELIFPRPRIAWRLTAPGAIEYWWYLGGEFGGGTYAVQRASGVDDVLTLRDFRAIVGLERQATGRFSTRFEAGYVFGREVEYKSGDKLDLDDTIMLRAGIVY